MSGTTRALTFVAIGFAAAIAMGLAIDALRPRPWRSMQLEYSARLTQAGLQPIPIGIRSVPGAGGTQDRCVSCHLGMVLPASFDGTFARHPDVACAAGPSEQGCISCHRGEPLGLEERFAHGRDRETPRALLAGHPSDRGIRDIEAGCASCHVDRDDGALHYDQQKVPEVARGLEVFVTHGCRSCHAVSGVAQLGEAGPPLTRVGLHRSRSWIRSKLRTPQNTVVSSPMPPLDVANEEAERLELFLMAQIGPERELGTTRAALTFTDTARFVDHMPPDLPMQPTAAAGALWIRAAGCAGCHRIDDHGGGVPDLRRVGWYAKADRLRNALTDPSSFAKGTYMPQAAVPANALDAILAYLSLQRAPLPSSQESVLTEVCGPCHGPARDPKFVVLSTRPPDVGEMARRLAADDFATVVEQGREGTAMAPWGRVLSRTFVVGMHGLAANQEAPR